MIEPKHGWDTFRPYKLGDLHHVWDDLRSEDLKELSGGGFVSPSDLEERLALEAYEVLTWDTEDGPVAVAGVTETENPEVGLVWAIASNRARPRWRYAVRHTEDILTYLGKDFMLLANFKDTRNRNQINWLKKVGFTFINRHRLGALEYLEFVRIMK